MKAKESSNSKESVQCLNKLRTLFGVSLTTTEISSCITARQDSCYLLRDMPMQISTLTLLLRWISTKKCSSLGQKMKEWKQKECCHQCHLPMSTGLGNAYMWATDKQMVSINSFLTPGSENCMTKLWAHSWGWSSFHGYRKNLCYQDLEDLLKIVCS